jgi:zinc/manganese transport system permease protein
VLDLIIIPLLAALIILVMHAYLGLHVLSRGVIFVDLAFAQIAALGTTAALLAGLEHGTSGSLVFALVFTAIGALIFSFTRLESSPIPQEAIIGIAYVVASAAVLLLAGFTAEGAEHIRETLTGNLIWVNWRTVINLTIAYVVLGAFHWVFRRQFLEASFEVDRAKRARLWDFLFYLSLGFVISFSVDVAGVLLVFSMLVIPGVIAFLFTDHLVGALLIAWGVGALTLIGGIVSSFVWDITTGPLLVVAFGFSLVIAAVVRPIIGAKTGTVIHLPDEETNPGGERNQTGRSSG